MAVNFLAGLKVLDLGQGVSAPFCAKMFADLGAQVIKVEPTGGDVSRTMGLFPGDVPDREPSGMFLAVNTNKLGVTLNLEAESGRDLLRQLAGDADLLVENFAPFYLPGLGLDFPRTAPAQSSAGGDLGDAFWADRPLGELPGQQSGDQQPERAR